MPDSLRPALELAVFAAALVLTGLLALLQRRPDVRPDWPPSPERGRRHELMLTGAAVLLLGAGGVVGLLAVVGAATARGA